MQKGDKMLDRYKMMSIQLISLSSVIFCSLHSYDNKCGRHQGTCKNTSTRDVAPTREDKEEDAQQGLKKPLS